jgi:hypothetical protein
MPQSTNAPFNEFGYSMVLRDIETLYIKLQELNNSNLINDQVGTQGSGDLNPGGGSQTSQRVPQDAWGNSNQPGAAAAGSLAGLNYAASGSQNVAHGASGVALTCMGNQFADTLGGWNPATGLFTAPVAGLYLITISLFVETDGLGGYLYLDIGPGMVDAVAPSPTKASPGAFATLCYAGAFFLAAGQTVALQLGSTAGAATLTAGGPANLSITRLS